MSSTWQSEVDIWLSTHHGVIAARQLRTLGCGPAALQRFLDRCALVRVLPGVFRSVQWPNGDDQRMVAACLRNPEASVGFTTAGRLWGIRRMPVGQIQLLVPHGRSPEMRGYIVHRCRRIDSVDIVRRPDGIRLTSPPRTLFDSADQLGLTGATSALEQLLNDGTCTIGTVADTVRRLASPGRPGSKTMLQVISSRQPWRAAMQSDLEVRVFAEIQRQGLLRPVTQCPVTLPGGRTIHLDFGWPAKRVGLEVDHPTWHAAAKDAHRDRNRDRKAATVGWRIARITDLDVHGRLAEAIADVGLILGQTG